MIYRPNKAQAQWFKENQKANLRFGFAISQQSLLTFLEEAQRAHKEYSWDQRVAWAAYNAKTHPNHRLSWIRRLLAVVVPLLVCAVGAQGQSAVSREAVVRRIVRMPFAMPQGPSGTPVASRGQFRNASNAWVDISPSNPLPVTLAGAANNCGTTAPAHTYCGNNTSSSATAAYVSIVAADLPGTITSNTSGNAQTATALAATPSTCGAGIAATGVLANGSATGCFTPGGLANPMTTLGDIIYGAASGTPTRLAANSTATNSFLRSVSSGVPVWAVPTIADIAAGSSAVNYTFSGTETFTGPLNSQILNNIQVAGVGANTTLQTTINNAMTAVGSQGCPEILVPPGYVETITSQLVVGSSTKCVTLTISRAALLTFNTNLANDAIAVWKTSSVVSDGINLGGPGVLANINVGPSGNYTSVIASYPRSGAEWVGYIRGITVNVDSAAPITNSVYDFNNATSSTRIQENTYIGGSANVLHSMRFTTDAGSTTGPVAVDNNYMLGNVGASTLLISQSGNGCCSVNVNVHGGTYNHPAAGFAAIDVEGGAASGPVRIANFNGVYIELNVNGSFGYLLNNATNMTINGGFVGAIGPMTTGGIAVKMAQTFSGGTGAIEINGLLNLGGTLIPTTISDTTQSPTVTIIDAQIVHYSLLPNPANDNTFSSYVNGSNANHGLGFQVIQSGTNGGAGLQAPMFRTNALLPAQFGAVRLAKGDLIDWRNNANGDDSALGIDASDNLQYLTLALGGPTTHLLFPKVSGTVAVNPPVATGTDLGSAALPWGNLWLGTAATNNFKFQPGATAGARIITVTDPSTSASSVTVNQAFGSVAYLTSNYTNATTTFSNVTGLSFAVAASTKYRVECDLDYQTSATTADVKIQWTGPASPTFVTYDMITEVTASTLSSSVATAFSTALSEAGTPTITTNFPLKTSLTLSNGANAGTIQLQAAATGTGTVTIIPGSCQLSQ